MKTMALSLSNFLHIQGNKNDQNFLLKTGMDKYVATNFSFHISLNSEVDMTCIYRIYIIS